MFKLGIDCTEISRFRDYHNDKLFKKIFTEKEIKYCLSKSQPSQHFAVRFAAKESVYKALSQF